MAQAHSNTSSHITLPETKGVYTRVIQPSPSAAADITATELVTYIIKTFSPYSYDADELLPFEPLPRPAEQDLNKLRLIVDLRPFQFNPLDFIDAAKAQPKIIALVGLPFTFFYTPPESKKKPSAKPWFFFTSERRTNAATDWHPPHYHNCYSSVQ